MKLSIRPVIFALTVLCGLALLSLSASGEGQMWNCPECGRTGNTGNYCGGCAHPAPWIKPQPTSSVTPSPSPSIDPTVSSSTKQIDEPISLTVNSIQWATVKNHWVQKFLEFGNVLTSDIEKSCVASPTYDNNAPSLSFSLRFEISGVSGRKEVPFYAALTLPDGKIVQSKSTAFILEEGENWLTLYEEDWNTIYNAYGYIPAGHYTFVFGVYEKERISFPFDVLSDTKGNGLDIQHGESTTISAYAFQTVVILENGTVEVAGRYVDTEEPCDISDWRNIVAVSAGTWHIVGLMQDGSVITKGENVFGSLPSFIMTDADYKQVCYNLVY